MWGEVGLFQKMMDDAERGGMSVFHLIIINCVKTTLLPIWEEHLNIKMCVCLCICVCTSLEYFKMTKNDTNNYYFFGEIFQKIYFFWWNVPKCIFLRRNVSKCIFLKRNVLKCRFLGNSFFEVIGGRFSWGDSYFRWIIWWSAADFTPVPKTKFRTSLK